MGLLCSYKILAERPEEAEELESSEDIIMATNATATEVKKRISLPLSSHRPVPYNGPSREEVLGLRRQYLTPGLITYYREPLLVVEGHMQYVWDETGKQYLDGFAGIVSVSVGHCHPKVVEKVREQVGKLQHTTTIYMHPTIGLFGKKLAEHMPPDSGLSVTYFTNSGSEANEVAILSAREYTGNSEVLSLRNGYHGGTQATMALTAHGTWKFKSNPAIGIKHATPGYCYRCPYGLEYPSCEVKCARDVEDLIRYETPGEVACFIASGSTAEFASPTKCRPVLAGPARSSGASRTGASRRIW